ncbi:hypothetical protein OL548_07430 [Lysinibacillus sp. MHQ-1]|nr:hypothetical protein OL548_07430 [Lysinibacillus sp. MHQ-1]
MKIFEKSPVYLRKTNMLFSVKFKCKNEISCKYAISNYHFVKWRIFYVQAFCLAHITMFKKDSEGNYPYSFQYITDPKANDNIIKEDLDYLEKEASNSKS